MNLKRLLIAISITCSPFAFAATLKSSAPQVYTVQSGDTLWKLAGQYTDNPWEWKQIWRKNRQVANPNQIYPGDELHIINGELVYKRKYNPKARAASSRSGGLRTVKLTPELREMPLETGIPAIAYKDIKNTIIEGEIMMSKDIKNLPYIAAFETKAMTGNVGKRVYIKGDVTPGSTYNIFRMENVHKGLTLDDIRKGRKRKQIEIGTELIKTGEITIERTNEDVSSGVLKGMYFTGVREGQYLMPQDTSGGIPNFYLDPKPAPQGTEAEIVSIPNKLFTAGKSNTLVIDRGLDAGLEPGDILLAQTDLYYTEDPHNPKKKLKIPGEAAGVIMIYKVFDRMSMGIILEATKPMKVGYKAVTPFSALP